MKRAFALLFCLMMCAYCAEKAPRRAVISKEIERIDDFEIVSPNNTPLMKWTSETLQRCLEAATGRKAAILKAPSGERLSIIIGDCDLAKAAGLDVNSLPEEGYYILRKGDSLFLAGRDSAKDAPTSNLWMQRYKRASLSAAYDFLERFTGARFVFPGEFWTAIPNRKALFLPREIDIMERPDYIVRTFYVSTAKGTSIGAQDKIDGVTYLNRVAMSGRWSEFAVPFTHGLACINLVDRFKDSHPEYFALMPDGRRHCAAGMHPGHICFSNNEVKDVIYEDIKAYLTGRPATERGIRHWMSGAFSGRYASVMPQDSFYWCFCEDCAKIAKGGFFAFNGNPMSERLKAANAINDVLWTFTKEMAERLTRDGIEGSVTQMAYSPSKEPPNFRLPDNIEIQVATSGLGNRRNWEKDRALLQRWKEKTGKSLSVWTYPGKHMDKATMRGIPAAMHHQMGEYFQFLGDYCCGAFIEEETDYVIFNFLNEYVFSRVAWNNSTDVNELLDDMYKSMFGAGANFMKMYFDKVEHLWCDKIIGNAIDSKVGPIYKLPTLFDVWQNIYSEAQMAEFAEWFDEAESLAANDAAALARIKFIREKFHGVIVAARKTQQNDFKGYREWNIAPGEKAWLHNRFWKKTEVRTYATVTEEDDELVVSWHCDEPKVQSMAASTNADEIDGPCWNDSDVEFFINPSGDRKTIYQIAVNSKGAVYDSKAFMSNWDSKWSSGAKVTPEIGDGYWKLVMRIPKKNLGRLDEHGVPMNFARHRVIVENGKAAVEDYQWALSTDYGFSDTAAWGSLVWQRQNNLLMNPDFELTEPSGKPQNWYIWKDEKDNPECRFSMDATEFVAGGQSLRFDKPQPGRIAANQSFKGKPNTKYRFSFYMKTENVVPAQQNAGTGSWIQAGKKAIGFPNPRVHGTTEWMRMATEFETDDGNSFSIGLWNWFSSGTVWFDHLVLEEIETRNDK